jgi:CRISPR-associated protein Csb2
VRVQREPFSAKGARAELFAPGTRFAKKQLWHVEIRFDEPVSGPLVLGDGRYFGLGLMEPRRQAQGFFALSILRGLKGSAHSAELCYALRRAVMSRVQEFLGPREHLPTFFSGHESDGAPARSGVHRHLSFAADLPRNRMLIVAPHLLEGRSPIREEREHLQTLESAIVGFTDLRAGAAGVLQLAPLLVDAEKDPVFAAAPMWESATPYAPTRHMKDLSPTDALISDLVSEMRRRNMVRPENVEILEIDCGPRGELAGRFRLQFRTAITGPVLLGRTCHLGGGMFVSANR